MARYADSNGSDEHFTYYDAWRFRNYVIGAINADKPFDRFLTEQLAGDLLPCCNQDERDNNILATGFLVVGPKVIGATDKKQNSGSGGNHARQANQAGVQKARHAQDRRRLGTTDVVLPPAGCDHPGADLRGGQAGEEPEVVIRQARPNRGEREGMVNEAWIGPLPHRPCPVRLSGTDRTGLPRARYWCVRSRG